MKKEYLWNVFIVAFLALSVINIAQTGQDYAEKAKYKTTMADMRSIAVAIKSYLLDFGNAPKAANIQELKKLLDIYYIKDCPIQDAWGNDFIYRFNENDPDQYWLATSGSDGKFDGFDQKGTWDTFKGQDIILTNFPPFWIYAPSIKDLALPDISGNDTQENYPTRLNPGNKPGIVRHPPAADYSQIHGGKLDSLPAYDPNSQNP